MTPVQRALASEVLAFDLSGEMSRLGTELAAGHTRIARTLVKEGPLRLTLIGISAGGQMHEHVSEGPITIHVLEGSIVLHVSGAEHPLATGELMAVDGGVRHAVSSGPGGIFLLTLVARELRAG